MKGRVAVVALVWLVKQSLGPIHVNLGQGRKFSQRLDVLIAIELIGKVHRPLAEQVIHRGVDLVAIHRVWSVRVTDAKA